ncbi:MAG: cytochrome c oxidase subunit [Acidimicrobiia bacterium]|jgi:cytochrome c oxidase subunit 4|nr:cytochrome c oxidase subunit [Acidimicrobiia bacterium]
MSIPDVGTPASAEHSAAAGHRTVEHHGPTDKQYVIVALVLGLITCVEVSTYFHSVINWGRLLMPALLIMGGIKFYLIAAYFMHLKYDRRILRRVFTTGIILAIGVYMIMLTAFKVFKPHAIPH